ncbi:response regulator transcription factor [Thioclava sp. F28-4]|uniref:response regulator transcription factor n=1 Tax=Thioclava sp. F28-4 TaxID=1915315 RepID=UPI000995FF80|nr:response regulator [Thioclava sp. F28-4]OOY06332.1 two-component system response regulator [Thioclava sp. F28-4]
MAQRQVLLIEDEPHIAEAIRFILTRAGWAVSVLEDGARAMARITGDPPDAIILDLMLPGRSGLEILADMRADAALRDLPVLMLSARGQGRDRDAATRAGATAFLAKPFANGDVLDQLEAITGGGAARREPA